LQEPGYSTGFYSTRPILERMTVILKTARQSEGVKKVEVEVEVEVEKSKEMGFYK
jgi:hypothetical protein